MKVVANRFITWLMGLTRLMRYLVIAVLFHVLLLAIIGSIKIVAVLPKIVAVFDAAPLPPPQEEPDPYAVYRDFEYSGPTLGGGGGAGGKGPGGIPTAGSTPEEYKAHILTEQAQATAPASVNEVIGVMSEAATAMARPTGGPENIGPSVTGLNEMKIGTSGVKGPGGPLGNRLGPARAIAIKNFKGSQDAERAVMAALRWLKANQRDDGSWKCARADEAGTSLALLAFLGHGETPDSPDFGPTVHKAMQYLASRVDANGMVSEKIDQFARGYTQGLVALALSEAYAMTGSPALRQPVERAIGCVLRWQTSPKSDSRDLGGWRYTANYQTSDLSVSGWMIMALKSAKSAGINIPPKAFDDATKYVWNTYRAPGFAYSTTFKDSAPATTGIGVLCMQFLGQGKDQRVKTALDYLSKQKVEWNKTKGGWVLYSWYYITQAMFQGGGGYWAYWNQQIRDTMVKNQLEDGRWPAPPQSEKESTELVTSPVYMTSLGALILEVYYRYLPIYQLLEGQQADTSAPALPQVAPLPTAPGQ
jgi:hypothetical protein